MKKTHLIALLFFVSLSGVSQNEGLLLERQEVTDWTQFPFYERITEEVNDKKQWKEEYRFLDSIALYEITYLSDGLKVKGKLVMPKKEGKYPSIIFNRGGNREFGALNWGMMAAWLGTYAKEGYVVIASQYRGNGGGEGMEEFGGAEVNDITVLPEVLKEIPEADTERIGMFGWSRGGMMTYLALAQTDKIKAAAVGGGMADAFDNIADRPDMETHVFSELIPNYWENKEEELTKRSAVKWVDRFPKNVPILLVHGTSDWRVKPENSLRMAMEFEKYRVPYRLIMFEGGDHGISEHGNEVDEQVLEWFNRFIKNGEALPNMEYHGR